jgi:hypothetical protein
MPTWIKSWTTTPGTAGFLRSFHRKVTVAMWKKESGHSPTEEELRAFLRCVFVEVYDFSPDHRLLRELEGEIRSHIVADPKEAGRAWEELEHFFLQADCRGVPANVVYLRKALSTDGIQLICLFK